jgi:hypothetical protein
MDGPSKIENYSGQKQRIPEGSPCSTPEECKVFYEQKLNEKREHVNDMREKIMNGEKPQGEYIKQGMPGTEPNMQYKMEGQMSPEMRERMMQQYMENPSMMDSGMMQQPTNMSGTVNMPPVEMYPMPTSN